VSSTMKISVFKLGVPYYRAHQAIAAANIFNPLYGKYLRIIHTNNLIMKLRYFSFPEFKLPFLQQMAKEADTVKQFMMAPFMWDGVPGAQAYNKKLKWKLELEAKEKKDACKEEREPRFSTKSFALSFNSWQDDSAEVARGMWEWWCVYNDAYFPCF
jgi:hypothetical protein